MRFSKSMRFWWVTCICLIAITGCRTFNSQAVNDPERRLSLKDSPAQKRTPRSLADLTGKSRPTSPPATPPHGPGGDTALAEEDKIGLDDVSLDRSVVHVDAKMDLEDIEEEAESQLPTIVESAVHPFSGMSPPYTISDQMTPGDIVQNQPPLYPVQTVSHERASNETHAVQETETSQARQEPHQVPPARSEPIPGAVPIQKAANVTPPATTTTSTHVQMSDQTGSTPVMRIVAQPEPATANDGAGSATDHLFADVQRQAQNTPVNIEPAAESPSVTPPVSVIPSTTAPQNAAPVQTINHQQEVTATDPATEAVQVIRRPNISQLTWDQQLDDAIRQLDRQLSNAGPNAEANQQIRLLLLKLAAGEVPQGPVTINTTDEQYREFWSHQLTTLGLLLTDHPENMATEAARLADHRRRATEASQRLQLAQGQLAGIATMQLAQCAFATEVRGFGQYTPIQGNFQSGQQVLIYCEVENYSLKQESVSGQLQQVAELQGRFTIIDQENRVVYQHQYQPVTDVAKRRRNDFYMFFPVTIPALRPGQYRLQLSVDDLVGDKIANTREDLVFLMSDSRRSAASQRVQPPTNGSPVYQQPLQSRMTQNNNAAHSQSAPNNNAPLPANGRRVPDYRR